MKRVEDPTTSLELTNSKLPVSRMFCWFSVLQFASASLSTFITSPIFPSCRNNNFVRSAAGNVLLFVLEEEICAYLTFRAAFRRPLHSHRTFSFPRRTWTALWLSPRFDLSCFFFFFCCRLAGSGLYSSSPGFEIPKGNGLNVGISVRNSCIPRVAS